MRRLGGLVRFVGIVGLVAASAPGLGGCGSAAAPSSSPASTGVTSGGAPTSGVTSGPTSQASGTTSPTTFPVPSTVLTHTRGLPDGAPAKVDTSYVTWGGAGQLLVVTFGSSTCPRFPASVDTTGTNAITVTIADTSSLKIPCTMDLVPTTSTVAVPAGIDDSKDVQVAIDDQESTLTPRKG